MNKITFILATFFSCWTLACNTTNWHGEGRTLATCYDGTRDAVVSSTCIGKAKCWATEMLLKKAPIRLLENSTGSEKNLGSAICIADGGSVIILAQASGDEAAFCEGADHSVVDINSLAQHQSAKSKN